MKKSFILGMVLLFPLVALSNPLACQRQNQPAITTTQSQQLVAQANAAVQKIKNSETVKTLQRFVECMDCNNKIGYSSYQDMVSQVNICAMLYLGTKVL
jgi:hypothetical protein